MRRLFVFFLCLLVLCLLVVPIVFADNGGATVYVTRTGYAYHRGDCYHLKSRIPMSLRDAVEAGYSPCKHCKPPLPDFTSSVSTAPPRSTAGRDDSRSVGSGSLIASVWGSVSSFLSSLPTPLVFVIALLLFPLPFVALYGVFVLFLAVFSFFSRIFRR